MIRPLRRMNTGLHGISGLVAMALVAFLGAGCFFSGDDDRPRSNQGGSWDDFPNPAVNMCGDITPAQMKRADSLVGLARPQLSGELDYFLKDSVIDWEGVSQRNLTGLEARYSAALKAAPNHCGALFGHAIMTAASVLNDPRLDSLVLEADKTGGFGGLPKLSKVASEGPAPALIGFKRGLASADRSLLGLVQDVGEKTLLPRLDTAIAELSKVDTNLSFYFDVGWTGEKARLDRGELAPLLAGLKLTRVALYLVAGYEWRAETDESYPHFKVLGKMEDGDFDSLTAEQVAALDYYTGLFKAGSSFSRIRAGWAPRLASIPDQLVQIVQHLQDGLAYGIRQADSGAAQVDDPYRVGKGEDADVDPADLKRGIADLERIKKYLRGVSPIAYNDGKDTLLVDIPKFFRIDGFQKLLPRYVLNPYEEWNDSIETLDGQTLKGPIYFTDLAGDSTMAGHELLDVANFGELTDRIFFDDPTFGGVFPGLTNATIWPTLEDLSFEGPRFAETCKVVGDIEECKRSLPPNPSDLDILMDWVGQLGL